MKICIKCGYERSDKDKNYPESECPGCGVIYSKIKDKPYQKKNFADEHPILFICSIILFSLVLLIASQFEHSLRSKSPSADTKNIADNSDVAIDEPVIPKWTTHESKNKMTGKVSVYAYSPDTYKILSSPYGRVSSTMCVGCDGESEWIYLNFSEEPNITNADAGNYQKSHIDARIRWNDNVEDVRLIQKWGSGSIQFLYSEDIIPKLTGFEAVAIELQWYGQGNVIFEYSLEGAYEALTEIRTKCTLNRYNEQHE